MARANADAGDLSALVARARDGDDGAFAALYDGHVARVRRIVADRLGDPSSVPDVVQEVFTRVYTRLDSLQDPEHFGAWIAAVARNAAVDFRRARRLRADLAFEPQDDEIVDDGPGAFDAVELRELQDNLRHGLAGLGDRDAMVLVMVVDLGLDPSEIAIALDITPNAARVTLHRARTRLKAAMDAPTVTNRR